MNHSAALNIRCSSTRKTQPPPTPTATGTSGKTPRPAGWRIFGMQPLAQLSANGAYFAPLLGRQHARLQHAQPRRVADLSQEQPALLAQPRRRRLPVRRRGQPGGKRPRRLGKPAAQLLRHDGPRFARCYDWATQRRHPGVRRRRPIPGGLRRQPACAAARSLSTCNSQPGRRPRKGERRRRAGAVSDYFYTAPARHGAR